MLMRYRALTAGLLIVLLTAVPDGSRAMACCSLQHSMSTLACCLPHLAVRRRDVLRGVNSCGCASPDTRPASAASDRAMRTYCVVLS
ncbi:hypothetical protein V8C86DRAFT_2668769, partial [Haematococcus lacustris]